MFEQEKTSWLVNKPSNVTDEIIEQRRILSQRKRIEMDCPSFEDFFSLKQIVIALRKVIQLTHNKHAYYKYFSFGFKNKTEQYRNNEKYNQTVISVENL